MSARQRRHRAVQAGGRAFAGSSLVSFLGTIATAGNHQDVSPLLSAPSTAVNSLFRSTFDLLIADLTKDVNRAQPRDALQFCADWFNARLQEQRTRIRDIFEQSNALNSTHARRVRGHSAPEGLFRDNGRTSRPPHETRQASMPPVVPSQSRGNPSALGPFGMSVI